VIDECIFVNNNTISYALRYAYILMYFGSMTNAPLNRTKTFRHVNIQNLCRTHEYTFVSHFVPRYFYGGGQSLTTAILYYYTWINHAECFKAILKRARGPRNNVRRIKEVLTKSTIALGYILNIVGTINRTNPWQLLAYVLVFFILFFIKTSTIIIIYVFRHFVRNGLGTISA